MSARDNNLAVFEGVLYAEIPASVVNVSFYNSTLALEATKLKARQGNRQIVGFFQMTPPSTHQFIVILGYHALEKIFFN